MQEFETAGIPIVVTEDVPAETVLICKDRGAGFALDRSGVLQVARRFEVLATIEPRKGEA